MALQRWLGLTFLCAALFSAQVESINERICMNPINKSGNNKPFPKIPNSFRAAFSWNMKTANTTFFTEEIFSEELNIGVMLVEDLIGPGMRSKLYTYAETNEFIYVPDYDGAYGGNCTVDELSKNDFAFPFTVVNGHDKLVSGKDVLMMGADTALMVYKGVQTIDDIDVDVWSGCMYIQKSDLTINATYYFTSTTTNTTLWKTASGVVPTIKRIHVIQDDSHGTSPSESTYEYVYFTDQIPEGSDEDMRIYEPPLGAYCEGRTSNKDLPTVPDWFSFYMEVYDPQQQLILYSDEYYDYTANLTRRDHNIKEDRSNVSIPVKTIHDFQTGLSYSITKYKGECVISPILKDSFDDKTIVDPQQFGFQRMRSPKEFFDFDNPRYPWIYEGTHVERGVECEVWISRRPFPTEDSNIMGYWEWYFTNSQYVISTGEVMEKLEPFKLVVTVPEKDNSQTEMNIYHFRQEPPNDRYYDISECFDQHNESRSYEFVMKANVAKYKLDKNQGMLQYWTAAAIEAFAGVRSLRVHNVEFVFDVTKVYVRFTILGEPKVTGDVKNPVNQLSLDEVEKYLKETINSEQFTVVYMMESGKETQFQVINSSLARLEYMRGTNQSVYYIIDDNGGDDTKLIVTQKSRNILADVGSGGVAAIAIVLLLLGAVLVIAPYFILSIRSKARSFDKSHLTMSDLQE